MESEISLVHPDDVDWFITLDETHHPLSTAGNKGGSTTRRYACSSFPRSGDRIVETALHTSGCYAFTLRGEPLPPLYILSTKSECEDNYRFDVEVCKGLPVVTGKYAQDKVSLHASRIAVRKKGSMDTSLWHDLHRSVYLTCGYENKLAPVPERDPVTKKLLRGPLIIKTDNGPGRLAADAASMKFREEMAELGVYILLGLPNGTEAQAELDQMYSEFKPRCKTSAVRVAGRKMKMRLEARQRHALDVLIDDDENVSGDGSDSESIAKKSYGQSLCNVSLTNRDLGAIVNGYPDDPVELRPFDYCFTKEKIIKSWIAVGFLPMTGKAALDPKVRHELGVGGAPQESLVRMEELVKDYAQSGKKLTEMGYNGEILDLQPRIVVDYICPATEEAQIEHIVKNKLVSSAGGLFKAGVLIANSRVVLEGARICAENQRLSMEEALDKKREREATVKLDGYKAFGTWENNGCRMDGDGYPVMNRKDAFAVVKVLLPRMDILKELKLSNFRTVKDCVKWLGEIGRGTTWDEEMRALKREYDEEHGTNDERSEG